jgi:succinyl-CoA synthetase beta subunit
MLTGPQALSVLAANGIPVRDSRTPGTARQRLSVGVALDRDRRCFRLLGGRSGENGASAGGPVAVAVDHGLGPRAFLVGRVTRGLGLRGAVALQAGEILRQLYEFAQAHDACDVEAFLVTDGGAIAVTDANIEFDPSGAFRNRDLAAGGAFDVPQTPIERALAQAAAVGIEVDPAGCVAGVISGAGLMMATLDQLVTAGIRPRLMVDLGGTVLRGTVGLAPVFEAIAKTGCPVILVNAFLQTARCDALAASIVEVTRDAAAGTRLVVRLKGREADRAREILAGAGIPLITELDAAIAATSDAACAVPA